jgi:hypothetical protein
MAKLYNLARMTTATTGTGTITLGSAVPSYVSFANSGVSNGETVTYAIVDGNNREVGRGVYTSSGTTLTRTVLESTNSNNPINLSGSAEVFITAAAEDIANVNEANTFSANQIISVTDNSNAALRVTQLGTGLALRVEDSTNPDSTPFVVTADGNVGVGLANPSTQLQVIGTASQNRFWLGSAAITNRQLFVRSNGTFAAPTIVASGNDIGSVNFFGYDGAANIELANITATVDGTPGTNDMPGRLTFSTTADGALSPTERMRIASNGLVGIGTNAPTHMLTVGEDSSGNPGNISLGRGGLETSNIFFTRNGINDAAITYDDSETLRIYNNFVGTPLLLGTEGTERLRISNAGVTTITGTGIINANSASDALRITQTGSGNALVVEDTTNPDSTPLVVTNDGQVVSGSTTSISGSAGVSRFQSNNTLAAFSAHYAGVDASPAINTFLKSRGGAVVNSEDQIGSFRFEGFDGTNYVRAAQISVFVDGTPGTNDMPGRITFSTTADGASSVTERLRISNGGNVLVTGSGGLGYGAGSGGTVTQATSKTTAVTLNKPTGQITMNNAALAAATSVTFTLNNSLLTAQDTLIVNHSTTGGTSGAYLVATLTVGAGTVVIRVTNITGGSLSEAAVINFAIIKGITT